MAFLPAARHWVGPCPHLNDAFLGAVAPHGGQVRCPNPRERLTKSGDILIVTTWWAEGGCYWLLEERSQMSATHPTHAGRPHTKDALPRHGQDRGDTLSCPEGQVILTLRTCSIMSYLDSPELGCAVLSGTTWLWGCWGVVSKPGVPHGYTLDFLSQPCSSIFPVWALTPLTHQLSKSRQSPLIRHPLLPPFPLPLHLCCCRRLALGPQSSHLQPCPDSFPGGLPCFPESSPHAATQYSKSINQIPSFPSPKEPLSFLQDPT